MNPPVAADDTHRGAERTVRAHVADDAVRAARPDDRLGRVVEQALGLRRPVQHLPISIGDDHSRSGEQASERAERLPDAVAAEPGREIVFLFHCRNATKQY